MKKVELEEKGYGRESRTASCAVCSSLCYIKVVLGAAAYVISKLCCVLQPMLYQSCAVCSSLCYIKVVLGAAAYVISKLCCVLQPMLYQSCAGCCSLCYIKVVLCAPAYVISKLCWVLQPMLYQSCAVCSSLCYIKVVLCAPAYVISKLCCVLQPMLYQSCAGCSSLCYIKVVLCAPAYVISKLCCVLQPMLYQSCAGCCSLCYIKVVLCAPAYVISKLCCVLQPMLYQSCAVCCSLFYIKVVLCAPAYVISKLTVQNQGCDDLQVHDIFSKKNVGGLIRHGMMVYWLSKIYELLDTLFMVLRHKGRQISFLHVFHHSSITLLADWSYFLNPVPAVVPVVALNSAVHVVMYGYYLLTALYPLQDFTWKKRITQMQILQFVLVICHVLVGWLYHGFCAYSVLYAFSMLALFSNFYYNAFYLQKHSRANSLLHSKEATKKLDC